MVQPGIYRELGKAHIPVSLTPSPNSVRRSSPAIEKRIDIGFVERDRGGIHVVPSLRHTTNPPGYLGGIYAAR